MKKSREDIVVMGIDILPGYSISSTKQPHYAVVVLRNGELFNSYEDVSFSRLIRLIWEYKPEIIAIDNVFELARNTEELVELMKIIPSKAKIVQVTGWGVESVNIETAAKNMGLDVRGKLSPLDTAYIAALIAYRGGGAVVKLLEEKTKIIVSRGRGVSHGGMSFDRYKRSIRAGILTVTKEIKKILDSHGFDYDLVFKKGKGGLEKSVFIVYASRDKLRGLIKPFKNKSVRLSIRPVYRNKIVFEEKRVRKPSRGLILGIDPGVYTGIAVIDLSGTPILIHSSKNMDRSEIINMVSSLGEVVVVATDTHQPPELVKKIAATLNAKLYVPQNDLSTEEKQLIINKLYEKYDKLEVRDTHERDALAAAYKAYTWVKDKLKNVEAKVDEMDIDIDVEKIKINVIKGRSFAEALEEELEKYIENIRGSTEKPVEKTIQSTLETEEKYREKIKQLKSKITYLESIIRELTKQLEEKDRIISDLKLELKSVRMSSSGSEEFERRIYVLKQEINSLNREIERKDKTIEELLSRIRELEDIVEDIWSGKYTLVPRIKNLCLSEVKRVIEKTHFNAIYVDEIYPLDSKAIEFLREKRIGILTCRDYGELYRELRIPIIKIDKPRFYKEYAIIEQGIFGKIDEIWKVIDELNNRDEYYRVLKLIREYQEKRKRSKRLQR